MPGDSRATGVVGTDPAAGRGRGGVTSSPTSNGASGSATRTSHATFSRHAERVAGRVDPDVEVSDERWLLLGATFTHEYSPEAASLCNPSMAAHPDQSDVPEGSLRFVMTVRGIGEGHRSSIGFRTGLVAADGTVDVDEPSPFVGLGTAHAGIFERESFRDRLVEIGADVEDAAFVLDHMGDTFTIDELYGRLETLAAQRDTRRDQLATAKLLRSIAACTYSISFPLESELSERVLMPAMAAEAYGMEDARLVRFVDDDGEVAYYASYTAFDGLDVTQQLLRTTDFVTFTSSPIVGEAAANKGLALFPRRIAGRFAALSRHDRETNGVALSVSPSRWGTAETVQVPDRAWEVVQLGNCGPPIETDAGWLVLTHGVGPMRTYAIGAILLDLDEPTKVVGALAAPLLTPDRRRAGRLRPERRLLVRGHASR